MQPFKTMQDLILAAYRTMPRPLWDFVTFGTESDTTVLRNRQAFDSLALRPCIMRDVRDIEVSTNLMGETLRIPVLLSPVGALKRLDPTGVVAAARAVAEFGTMQIVSGVVPDFTEIPRQSSASLIYAIQGDIEQAYPDDLVDRVVDAGYKAIAFVAEAAYFSRRERDMSNNLISGRKSPSSYAGYLRERRSSSPGAAEDIALTLDWKLLDDIRKRTDLPLILKGVTSAQDAIHGVDHGVDVIYVSNHGGRALDHCLGSAHVLPEIVAAVAGRVPIILDGGITRGTDVLKALALGASAVCVGRLQAWAFAAAGQAGILRMLEILEEELVISAGLLGISSIAELSASHVAPVAPVFAPHPLNAFPLVMERLRAS